MPNQISHANFELLLCTLDNKRGRGNSESVRAENGGPKCPESSPGSVLSVQRGRGTNFERTGIRFLLARRVFFLTGFKNKNQMLHTPCGVRAIAGLYHTADRLLAS